MIELVILGHGTYAYDVKKAIEFFGVETTGVYSLDCDQTTNFEQYKIALEVLLKKVGNDILIFADMMDASPYRAAKDLAKELRTSKNIDIISGYNLGMLLQANAARAYVFNVHDLATLACNAGLKQIYNYDELAGDE